MKILLGAMATLPLLLAQPACADEPIAPPLANGPSASAGQQLQEGGALIRQGLEKVIGSIAASLRAIPQFAPPQFDEQGNIILRRMTPGGDSVTGPSLEGAKGKPDATMLPSDQRDGPAI